MTRSRTAKSFLIHTGPYDGHIGQGSCREDSVISQTRPKLETPFSIKLLRPPGSVTIEYWQDDKGVPLDLATGLTHLSLFQTLTSAGHHECCSSWEGQRQGPVLRMWPAVLSPARDSSLVLLNWLAPGHSPYSNLFSVS